MLDIFAFHPAPDELVHLAIKAAPLRGAETGALQLLEQSLNALPLCAANGVAWPRHAASITQAGSGSKPLTPPAVV